MNSENKDIFEYLENNPIDIELGLNSEEIKYRKDNNQINVFKNSPSKTLKEIIIKNTFTLFNFINVFLAILIIITGSYINLTFMVLIIINTAIGIFQEWRAKKTMEKLSLLRESKVSVLRNGETFEIHKNELLKDDILILKKGMQIPVDAILIDDNVIDVDESQLTGESDFITKNHGDLLYSGSLMMQGHGKAQVYKYGKDTYINKLSQEAKKYKILPSELQKSIQKIIQTVTVIIIPTGIMLFINQLFFVEDHKWQHALVGSVAGIVGMIPEGLVLLTSVAMAVGVIRLAMINTLTQDMQAIETLARADTLCLDKTGTLTEGKLKVNKVVYFSKDEKYLNGILNAIAKNDTEQNVSTEALKDYFKEEFSLEVKKQIPFSSKQKWQAIEFANDGTWILGAPDMIIKEDDILDESNNYSEQGFRVLAVLNCQTPLTDDFLIPEDSKTEMLIVLEDQIRPEASEILDYFKKQKVKIKIISGDNPLTVSNLAKQAGLLGEALDANILHDDIDSLKEIVEKTVIFGRVKPEQKSLLIEAMQRNGHIVAMTGDGINDILALKKSDCGIAMASGSDATQAVAQFVLLDSKFTSLPEVIRQGRRVINNISRVACLFLVKTFYSLLLSILMILGSFAYPYEPIQLSLVSLFAVGIPSFLLALEPNDDPIKGNFFKRIIATSLPSSVVIAFTTFIIVIINNHLETLNLDLSRSELSTLVILYIGCVQIWTLYSICKPLNRWRGTIVLGVFILFITCFLIKPLRFILKFTLPALNYILITLAFIAISILTIWLLRRFVSDRILNNNKK